MLTDKDLTRASAETGFRPDALERVIRLVELLDTLCRHPYLEPRIALKGGTALNLFTFDLPRLSVDIDINYVGARDRETMRAERPKMEQAIEAVCGRLGIQIRRVPQEHAGGKWRLSYASVSGSSRVLELDTNFVLRTPLWPPRRMDSYPIGPFRAMQVPVLDVNELAAGKLAALLARDAGRDLFDARELLRRGGVERGPLRISFVVYGAMNRLDWRTVGISNVAADPAEVDNKLVPMLRADVAPDRAALEAWTRQLVDECRQLLGIVLPLEPHEREFLSQLNDGGVIRPDLLTDDDRLASTIAEHPGLQWKALNVRKRLGLGGSTR